MKYSKFSTNLLPKVFDRSFIYVVLKKIILNSVKKKKPKNFNCIEKSRKSIYLTLMKKKEMMDNIKISLLPIVQSANNFPGTRIYM